MRRTSTVLGLVLTVLLAACGSGDDEPCKGCAPSHTPDARAVLDPGEQVLGVRQAGTSERVCSPLASFIVTRDGSRTTGSFEVLPWLQVDGLRVLVRDGASWKVQGELSPLARTFTIDGAPDRVALQAVRGGREGAPVEPAAPAQGLERTPPPRAFHAAPQGLTAEGTLAVTLDASQMESGSFRAVTRWADEAREAADELVLISDLAPVAVRWNGESVGDFLYERPTLHVPRSVGAGESFELEVEVAHEGAPLDVHGGATLYAHLGSDFAFAAALLRWYAEPEDGSVHATSLSILAPPGMEVAGPGVRTGPVAEEGASRWEFAVAYPAAQLPFAIGPFAGGRSEDGLAAAMHHATCATGQDASYAESAKDIASRMTDLLGALPAGAITFVGIDGDPTNDPCDMGTPTDEDVATLSRPGIVFGPSYLWEGPPTINTDFFFAHETSHQWWGLVVRPDPADAWLSEGMADHSAGLHVRAARGREAEREVLRAQLPYLYEAIAGGRDAPVRPADPAKLVPEVYYVKGSWVLRGLEAWIGEDRWAQLLRDWASANLHQRVRTDELESRVRAIVGDGVTPYFETWVRGTGIPDVTCADFYEPDGSAGEILVHQGRMATVAGVERPFVLPLHVSAVRGGRELSGFAVIAAGDGTVDLRP